jgi:hypothetical protein
VRPRCRGNTVKRGCRGLKALIFIDERLEFVQPRGDLVSLLI